MTTTTTTSKSTIPHTVCLEQRRYHRPGRMARNKAANHGRQQRNDACYNQAASIVLLENRIVIQSKSPAQTALGVPDTLIVAATLAFFGNQPQQVWTQLLSQLSTKDTAFSSNLVYSPTLLAVLDTDRESIRQAVQKERELLLSAAEMAQQELLQSEEQMIRKNSKKKKKKVGKPNRSSSVQGGGIWNQTTGSNPSDDGSTSSRSSDSDAVPIELTQPPALAPTMGGGKNPRNIEEEGDIFGADWISVKKRIPKAVVASRSGEEELSKTTFSETPAEVCNIENRNESSKPREVLGVNEDENRKKPSITERDRATNSAEYGCTLMAGKTDPNLSQTPTVAEIAALQNSTCNSDMMNNNNLCEVETLERQLSAERQRTIRLTEQLREKDDSLQALQLRLYIAETRLATYIEALEQHVRTVEDNVSSTKHSPSRCPKSRVVPDC